MLETLLILFFPFLMAYAATSDLFSMTISNKVSIGLILGFCVMAYFVGMDLQTFGWHWVVFAIALIFGFCLFAVGVMGGGDAKLIASTALWFGWAHTMEYALMFSIFGGLLTLALLNVRGAPIPDRVAKIDWIARLYRADTGIPYGIALGAAAMMVYPSTPWMEYVFESARTL